MRALAIAALEQVIHAERRHARRWVARITSHRPVKGERGDAYAWRQARRHLCKARQAETALVAIGGAS